MSPVFALGRAILSTISLTLGLIGIVFVGGLTCHAIDMALIYGCKRMGKECRLNDITLPIRAAFKELNNASR